MFTQWPDTLINEAQPGNQRLFCQMAGEDLTWADAVMILWVGDDNLIQFVNGTE